MQGIKSKITFVYLSRTLEWERRLPEDMRKQVQPSKDPGNPTSLPSSGKFKEFPNISTYLQFNPSAEMANLISDLCGWIVLNNKDAFRAALGVTADN